MVQDDMSETPETRATYEGFLLPRPRRLFDFARSAWCICGIWLLFLIAIDLGLSLYFFMVEPEPSVDAPMIDVPILESAYGRSAWLNELFRENGEVRMRWSSSVYWTAAPQRGLYVNVDSRGIRATFRSRRSSLCMHRVKIFMFGGSTMFGYEVRDDYTIPSWLQKLLDASSYCAEVSNFGQDGYVSTQEMLALFEQLKKGNRPDIVIFYDGWNDIASANQNGTAGQMSHEEARREEFNLTNSSSQRDRVRLYVAAGIMFGLHTGFGKAAKRILKVLSPNRFALVKGQLVRIGATASGSPAVDDPRRAAHDVVRVYLFNKELIESVAERFGFRCLFYWQPCVLTKRILAPLEKRQMEQYYGKLVGRAGTELFHRVYSEIGVHATQDGIIDLSDLLGSSVKPYYFDEVHTTEEGNRVVARRLLPDIIPLLSERDIGPAHASQASPQAGSQGRAVP